MPLDIVFGWHLDGLSFPETCTTELANLGGLVVGPVGLAEHLAIRLGVRRPFTPQAVRIARYMQALAQNDDGDQFYTKSFALDPWSTASCLLVMRDQLISAGWHGAPLPSETAKVHSLAKVEPAVYPLGSPAEQLRALVYRLRDTKKELPIKNIKLVTPLYMMPAIWQEIFRLLQLQGIRVKQTSIAPAASKSTDLGKLQRFVSASESSELKNDGTVCLLEADDEYQLSEAVVGWLKASRDSDDLADILMVRGAPTLILDAFCNQHGLSRFGGHKSSRWRSALQVLPLMFETCWEPANPYRTLELLSLPMGPIPKSLGHFFIKALRIQPGFGGECWSEAWHSSERALQDEAAARTGESAESIEQAKKHADNLRLWLEPTKYSPSVGMPLQDALNICKLVRKWASNNLAKNNLHRELFARAKNLSEEMSTTLRQCGLDTINKIQMGRILDAVSGEGCKPERWRAQAAKWSIVDHTGQIWGPANTLIWWGFGGMPIQASVADPWTTTDREILALSNIHIEPPSQSVIREAFSWRQALLNAKEEVLLCRSKSSQGKSVPEHPLWHELEELTSVSPDWSPQQAHQVLNKPLSVLGTRSLRLHPSEPGCIPKPQRDWTAPKGLIQQRPEESVSSMQTLFGCQLAWVLRYQAQLHPGILLTLPDGDKLFGDIAHKLFNQLFQRDDATNNVGKRAKLLFDELINTVGLPLLLRGRKVERENAKRMMVAAAELLVNMIADANFEVLGCETEKQSPFGEGKFIGTIDLLLKDQENRKFLVDLKWNKSANRRLSEIESNRPLQLAAYAWLAAESTENFPDASYFLLRQRRLIHCGSGTQNIGQFVSSSPLEQIWKSAADSYFSNIEQLNNGAICANGVSEEKQTTKDELAFRLEPPCKVCSYKNICGTGALADE